MDHRIKHHGSGVLFTLKRQHFNQFAVCVNVSFNRCRRKIFHLVAEVNQVSNNFGDLSCHRFNLS
ncbi:hypothetical protein [Salmonella phage SD-2_S15]|nr:hypothetical protein [Salmonella phage SD-2_S15]